MTLFYCFYSAFPLHVFRANSFNDIILLFLQCIPTSCSSEQTVSMTLFYYFYSAFPLHVLQIKQFQRHYFIVSIVLSHFMVFRANSFNDIILLFLQCFPTSCSSDQAVSRTLFYSFYSAFPLHGSSEQTVSMTLFYCFYSAFPLHVLQSKQFQGHYLIVSIVLSHFMYRTNRIMSLKLFALKNMKWESTIEIIK